jgi:hypothetical protein
MGYNMVALAPVLSVIQMYSIAAADAGVPEVATTIKFTRGTITPPEPVAAVSNSPKDVEFAGEATVAIDVLATERTDLPLIGVLANTGL